MDKYIGKTKRIRWVAYDQHPQLSFTMIGNNVCNEGKTSTDILQKIGCEQEPFTCDDGKCLDMSQRCKLIVDCDDVSDEKNCRTVYIDPEKNLKLKLKLYFHQ